MSEQPPNRWASPEDADDVSATEPVRRSGVALTALMLGVLSIPLALTVYLGALAGLLGLLLGVIGMVRTRSGRATGRGMAMAGLIAGMTGLVVAISLGALSLHTYRQCEARLGHRPSRAEWDNCVHNR
jgi:uncharacterized membrane protein HdeD (DUF308 family)